MKSISWILAATFALCTTGADADRDIVFSMQKYRWNQESDGTYSQRVQSPNYPANYRYLVDEGKSWLYTIDPKGGKPKHIPTGGHPAHNPLWSPDGRWILFSTHPYENIALYVVRSDGKELRKLADISSHFHYGRQYFWRPDGQEITAFEALDWLRISWPSGKVKRVPHVQWVSWSPDSKRAYVSRNSEYDGDGVLFDDHVLDLHSAEMRPMSIPLATSIWLDADTLIGVPYRDRAILGIDSTKLVWLNRIGSIVRMSSIAPEGGYDLKGRTGSWLMNVTPDGLNLINSTSAIPRGELEWETGVHHLATRKYQHIAKGPVCGLSPDGRRLVIANNEWAKPYKRGTRRIGPLKIYDLQTGKSRTLVSGLVEITGGDWRVSR